MRLKILSKTSRVSRIIDAGSFFSCSLDYEEDQKEHCKRSDKSRDGAFRKSRYDKSCEAGDYYGYCVLDLGPDMFEMTAERSGA